MGAAADGLPASRVAEMLDISKQRVSQLLRSGRLRHVHPATRPRLIRLDDVERELAWRETRQHSPRTASNAWPPSKRNQLDIIATMLAIDMVDVGLIDLKKLRKVSGVPRRDLRGLMLEKRLEKIGGAT